MVVCTYYVRFMYVLSQDTCRTKAGRFIQQKQEQRMGLILNNIIFIKYAIKHV